MVLAPPPFCLLSITPVIHLPILHGYRKVDTLDTCHANPTHASLHVTPTTRLCTAHPPLLFAMSMASCPNPKTPPRNRCDQPSMPPLNDPPARGTSHAPLSLDAVVCFHVTNADAVSFALVTPGYTKKAHIARAMLEAICFSVREVLDAMRRDSNRELACLRVDGGCATNNLLMQLQVRICGDMVPLSILGKRQDVKTWWVGERGSFSVCMHACVPRRR